MWSDSLASIGQLVAILHVRIFVILSYTLLDDHSLLDDNEERIQIVQKIVDELNLKNIIFIGHSRGSECALKMAALNQVCIIGLYINTF
jgi:hypothetical protein